jgi:diguanylate cyclase (GGDEF)-like protein
MCGKRGLLGCTHGAIPMSDELGNTVKKSALAFQKVQPAFSFLLFALTALVILAYPLDQPVEILRHGFRSPTLHGSVYFHLTAGFAAWLLCLGAPIIMWRAANAAGDDLPAAFTHSVFLVFTAFFAIERLASLAVPWMLLRGSAHRLQWVQLLSAVTVAMGAAAVMPRLRRMREGFAMARIEHDRFLASAENSLDDFYIFDGVPDASGTIVDFRFSYINPNAERRLHVKRESLMGKILTEVRPFMITSGLIEKYREVVRTGVPFTCEVFLDDEMIKGTWLNVQVVKLGDGIAITSRDVTERKRLTDHVNYLAHYDQLTGLPNRTLLYDRLHQAMLRAQRHDDKVAVFVLDIDHFKRINDSLGHLDGDALLRAVGKRLLSAVRQTDTVARMGGDEFVIIMPEVRGQADVERCGGMIIEAVAGPVDIGERKVNVTVSAGACMYPDHGLEADYLLRNADAAMYEVKESGRNGLRIFSESVAEKNGYQC